MFTRPQIIALVAVAGAVWVGFWLHEVQPSEKNRFAHPAGYSVCLPDDWSAQIGYGDGNEQFASATRVDGLSLSPDHFDGFPPRLEINRFLTQPDPKTLKSQGWIDGTFQDQPALILNKTLSHGMARGAVFERFGNWFQLLEKLTIAGSAQQEQWWRFLETFRFAGSKTPAQAFERPLPTSLPASTAPFVLPAMGQ